MEQIQDLQYMDEASTEAGPEEVAKHIFSKQLESIPNNRFWHVLGGIDNMQHAAETISAILVHGVQTVYPEFNLLELNLDIHLPMMTRIKKYMNHLCFDFSVDEKDMSAADLMEYNDYCMYLGHIDPPYIMRLPGHAGPVGKYCISVNPHWNKHPNIPLEEHNMIFYNSTLKKLYNVKFRLLRITFTGDAMHHYY
jgi:hypothetical protein